MMALSAYDSSVEQKMCLDNNNFVHFGTKKNWNEKGEATKKFYLK